MYKWIILMSGLSSLTACAKVKLSPLFSIRYFQQEVEVPVWGKHSRNASYSDSFMEWGEMRI